jgi:hypothetical protein
VSAALSLCSCLLHCLSVLVCCIVSLHLSAVFSLCCCQLPCLSVFVTVHDDDIS